MRFESRRVLRAGLQVFAGLLSLSAVAADVDIGVSIQISQPGVYGRIDIGRYPSPVLVHSQPVRLSGADRHAAPVYLWVPPGHQKHWGKHCHRYNACRVPVFFVEESWYQRHVAGGEGRDSHPGKGQGKGQDKDRGHGHGKGRD